MILEVKNGGFSYQKGQRTLKNISFAIEDHSIVAILGPNGIGKTTLLKCITGLLRWTEGASYFHGKNIAEMSTKEIFKKIAYVPQAKNTTFAYTVEDMVLMGRASHIGLMAKPKKHDRELADQAMEMLGITKLRYKSCNRISGGQLQMALIARALCQEPEVLVLDEPESNLDFRNQLIILDTIKRLAKQKITCLFNTHYPNHALNIADHALVLGHDSTTVFGPVAEVLTEERVQSIFNVEVDIAKLKKGSIDYTAVTALQLL